MLGRWSYWGMIRVVAFGLDTQHRPQKLPPVWCTLKTFVTLQSLAHDWSDEVWHLSFSAKERGVLTKY